jgi:hypothetical protein
LNFQNFEFLKSYIMINIFWHGASVVLVAIPFMKSSTTG